jgi:8-oxo-dGTP pyrophosphatase MutT (NUDIX family)
VTLLSCGVLLLNPADEILLAHATSTAHWDIPKGAADPGEAPRAAAVRETREETGLALRPALLDDLGEMPYRPGKRLHLFAAKVARESIDPARLRCTSWFWDRRSRRSIPEMDDFAWVPFDQVADRCARTMGMLLAQRIGLAALGARLPLVDAIER